MEIGETIYVTTSDEFRKWLLQPDPCDGFLESARQFGSFAHCLLRALVNGRSPFIPQNFLRDATELPIRIMLYQLEDIDAVRRKFFLIRFSPDDHRSSACGRV